MVDINRTPNAKPSIGMLVRACRPQANRGPRPRWLKMAWVIDLTLFFLMQITSTSIGIRDNEFTLFPQEPSGYVWPPLFSMGVWCALWSGWEAARVVKIVTSGLIAFAVWMPTGYNPLFPEARHPLESVFQNGFIIASLVWIFLLTRREAIDFTRGVSTNSQ